MEYFRRKARELLSGLTVEFNFSSLTRDGEVLRAGAVGLENDKIVKVVLWGRTLTPKLREVWRKINVEVLTVEGFRRLNGDVECLVCGNVWRKRGRGLVRCPACQSFLGYYE